MIELAFQVSPQIQVGEDVLDVAVTGSPTIFPDHAEFVCLRLTRVVARKLEVLVERSRVPATERSVEAAIFAMAAEVRPLLMREAARRRKLRGY